MVTFIKKTVPRNCFKLTNAPPISSPHAIRFHPWYRLVQLTKQHEFRQITLKLEAQRKSRVRSCTSAGLFAGDKARDGDTSDMCIRLDVFLTVHHELTILYINYQLDAPIIIYS